MTHRRKPLQGFLTNKIGDAAKDVDERMKLLEWFSSILPWSSFNLASDTDSGVKEIKQRLGFVKKINSKVDILVGRKLISLSFDG